MVIKVFCPFDGQTTTSWSTPPSYINHSTPFLPTSQFQACYTFFANLQLAIAREVLCTIGMAEKISVARKAGLITKTLDRCRSTTTRNKPAEGCFSVYVGADRQRYVVRMECLNHPLFQALLEEAEEAFGYADAGPLELPCNIEAFAKVLEKIGEEKHMAARRRHVLPRVNSYRSLGTGWPMIVGRS
ncbi:auxin-responsive protein SAUR66-like [Triticum dicoccoides]|uniref:auxin-responsive protein SAUR66-like n=1 Tax=Triticum dicoccoides TaxID=85692 RepID=UPI001890BC00|nr:auxin-responsive protein SAUR66-like [Triticum dicoccoides]